MDAPFLTINGDCMEEMHRLYDAGVRVDAVVTDPPYLLGFMGQAWDGPDGIAGRPDVWRLALNLLKPGGHLLAFSGSRTYHRIACAIEDAGFEIRDQLLWLYSTGFPKSMNVAAAIDKQRHDRDDVLRVTAWIAEMRDSAGMTNKAIDDTFGFVGMAGHWTSKNSQPAVPTLEQIPTLLQLFSLTVDDVPADIKHLIWTLNGNKGQPGKAWFEREVTGSHERAAMPQHWKANNGLSADLTPKERRDAPASDAAKKWSGWGTALKPAHEPIVMARKPLEGTVANNVLKHGTGALHIDACRVEGEKSTAPSGLQRFREWSDKHTGQYRPKIEATTDLSEGRWPANLIHDGSAEVLEAFGRYGTRKSNPAKHFQACLFDEADAEPLRFFHSGKASKSDRNEHLTDGQPANVHPTVKPTSLMQYCLKIVVPPGGTVLDPFMGSGSTGKAAMREGIRFIGIEQSPEFHAIAEARIVHALANRKS